MFRPNWPSSSVKVKVAGETTAYNKIITAWYFKNNFKIFCKYFTPLKCRV
jgi:hypothetical protein